MVWACFFNVPQEDVTVFAAYWNSCAITVDAGFVLKVFTLESFELDFLEAFIKIEKTESRIVCGNYDLFLAEKLDARNFTAKSELASSVFAIYFGYPIKPTEAIT